MFLPSQILPPSVSRPVLQAPPSFSQTSSNGPTIGLSSLPSTSSLQYERPRARAVREAPLGMSAASASMSGGGGAYLFRSASKSVILDDTNLKKLPARPRKSPSAPSSPLQETMEQRPNSAPGLTRKFVKDDISASGLQHGPFWARGTRAERSIYTGPWSLEPKQSVKDESLYTFHVHNHAVSSLCVAGQSLFASSYDKTICQLDVKEGKSVFIFKAGHSFHCVKEQCGLLYAGDNAGQVHILDARVGTSVKVIKCHQCRGKIVLSVESERFITGGTDSLTNIWDIRTHNRVATLKVHTGPVTCIESCNGDLYTGSWDGTVYMVTKEGEKRRFSLGIEVESPVVNFSSAGDYLYVAYRDGKVRAWTCSSKEPVGIYAAHSSPVASILSDTHDGLLFTGSDDRSITVWDLKASSRYHDKEKSLYSYKGHTDGVLCLAKAPNLLYSGGFDHTVKIWNAQVMSQCVMLLIDVQ